MDNKTQAVKVTLRPTQIQKVKRVAKKDFEGNFSLCLRVMIDKFEEVFGFKIVEDDGLNENEIGIGYDEKIIATKEFR